MENPSSFQFDGFRITKSHFDIGIEQKPSELSVSIEPYGKLDKANNLFHLILETLISDTDEKIKIEINTIGFFKFDNIKEKELEPFLYHNAPALLFPYIRAYISSLTTLSGIKPITLPTLNLSNLKDKLESNVEEVALK